MENNKTVFFWHVSSKGQDTFEWKNEIVKNKLETTESLNNFYENVIKNLIISKYKYYDPLVDSIENHQWNLFWKIESIHYVCNLQKTKKKKRGELFLKRFVKMAHRKKCKNLFKILIFLLNF